MAAEAEKRWARYNEFPGRDFLNIGLCYYNSFRCNRDIITANYVAAGVYFTFHTHYKSTFDYLPL